MNRGLRQTIVVIRSLPPSASRAPAALERGSYQESLDKLCRWDDRKALREREQIRMAGDELIPLSGNKGRQDHPVICIPRPRYGDIPKRNARREERQQLHEQLDVHRLRVETLADHGILQHGRELLVQRIAEEKFQSAVPDRLQDAAWDSVLLQQRRHEDVGVQNDFHAQRRRRRAARTCSTASSISFCTWSAGTLS